MIAALLANGSCSWEMCAAIFVTTNLAWIGLCLYMGAFRRKGNGHPAPSSGKWLDTDWERALEAKERVETRDDMGAVQKLEGAMHVPYHAYKRYSTEEMAARAASFFEEVNRRRTVRFYSSQSFPVSVLRDCVRAAGTAPSGANLQPWTYVIVSKQAVKSQIRELVEREEEINYARRMRESWKADLAHLGTGSSKPYLGQAPYIVCVFKHSHRIGEDGEKLAVYYPEQSVGISVGLFLNAVHNAGLVTLTSTPMGAETGVRELLGRPENERLYLLMPVGFPADDCTIPNITRKPAHEICVTD
eukprot:TRINITY_DN9175_c0_g1_i1.p2 TRINITY_DN9175_c0_g1~~TRINITY_DN9175_c0_g1_i1.p2  ORF type:complete len:302 (+),score=115.92 TRINITY_DN9175_c0_g1_i1:88-993(+)